MSLNHVDAATLREGTLPDGSIASAPLNGLGFQTFALLANGATYDSGVLYLDGYTQVQTHVLSDKLGTITIDFIRDEAGTDVLRTLTIPYVNIGVYETFSAPSFTPYVRYRFTCDEVGQTDFYFDTKFLTVPLSPQILGVGSFISPLMVANLQRAIIAGQVAGGTTFANATMQETSNDDGTYQNLSVVSGARPSQLAGRTPVKIVIDNVSASALQYTVSADKTLFITDMILTVINSSNGNDGDIKLEDGIIASQPVILPLRTPEAPTSGTGVIAIDHQFTEPIEFATGVWLNEANGTLTISGILNGYEE